MNLRLKSWTSRTQRLLLLLAVIFCIGFYFMVLRENDDVMDFYEDYAEYHAEILKIVDRIQYWDMKNSKTPKPVIDGRYFVWQPWSAGFFSISLILLFICG